MNSKRRKQNDGKHSGRAARGADLALRSYTIGALPILNEFFERVALEEWLEDYLPTEDGRTRVSTARVLTVLVKNMIMARQPLYGVKFWASRHVPELLNLRDQEMGYLNDDRIARSLDRLFRADQVSLLLSVVAHVVEEFGISLDQLHNDSTTVRFTGEYVQARKPSTIQDVPAPAITWGHSNHVVGPVMWPNSPILRPFPDVGSGLQHITRTSGG